MCLEFILDLVDLNFGLGCQGHVINEHWDDNAHITTKVDPDTVLTENSCESYGLKYTVQLLMPDTRGLLQAINGLQ
jgi:hypothetical protein